MVLCHAPQAGPAWFAFVYAGDLPTSGFGVNSAGISYSLNAVFPAAPLLPGIARNFVSRQLLEASSMTQALAIITTPGQVKCAHGAVSGLVCMPLSRLNIQLCEVWLLNGGLCGCCNHVGAAGAMR